MEEKEIVLKKSGNPIMLKQGQTVYFTISGEETNTKSKHTLFFTCEDASNPMLKNEGGMELFGMYIDDSLNTEKAEMSRYCLDLSCERPFSFAKRSIKKLIWKPLHYGLFDYKYLFVNYDKNWTFGIFAKAENLKIEKGGFLRLRMDRWTTQENIDPNDTLRAPDETILIDIADGTYPLTQFAKKIQIKDDETACIIVTVEGKMYSGHVYFERPFLFDSAERNMLPPFEPANLGFAEFAWLGQNLSKREWPQFNISINGCTVFKDEVFLIDHPFPPVEIELPERCFQTGDNELAITYISDYLNTIPVYIDEVMLLEEEKKSFSVVHCPESVCSDRKISILVETELSEKELWVESEDFTVENITVFADFEFCVIEMSVLRPKNNLAFTLKSIKNTESFTVARCIQKTKDGIMAGSGDMIYVDISNPKAVRNYVKWYVANDIGDLLTVRPVYRWSGARSVNESVWSDFVKLCEKLNISYVLISDGRDIAGISSNPTERLLSGKNFLGKQLHERDGQLFYWAPTTGHSHEIEAPLVEFYDLAARLAREEPNTIEGALRTFNLEWVNGEYAFKRSFCKNGDVREIHDIAADELKDLSRDKFVRHTGASVMFKYFYQNGFEWTGAETMYGATEAVLAFLRGASFAYDKERFGAHLAVQWSTYPHCTEQRYRRYLLSMYIPYLHGVTDINTEEGLYLMGAYSTHHHRLSEPCVQHREQLNRFNRFLRTHSRTGKFYTPIAFLHGRMDGWNGIYTMNVWGMPFMKHGDDARSWQLLKTFYPLNYIANDGLIKNGGIPDGNSKPFGFFSGTPMGNVDVIPVEHGDLSQYSVLVFAGYNAMSKNEIERLWAYVENGGTLICSWAHFSDTTHWDDVMRYRLNIPENKITKYLTDGAPSFVSDAVSGKEIKVCSNISTRGSVTEKTDSGHPLVYVADCKKGKFILINSLYYPGNESVFPVYQKVVKAVAEESLQKEMCVVTCGEDVEYSIYIQDDGTRHYYFTAVDWYNDSNQKRHAKITFKGNTYPIEMPFGEIVKVVTNGHKAVWPMKDSAEVLSVSDTHFTAQGIGLQTFCIAFGGTLGTCEVNFDERYVQNISFK